MRTLITMCNLLMDIIRAIIIVQRVLLQRQ